MYIKHTKEKNLALKCLNLINHSAFWGCSRTGGGGWVGGEAKRLILPENYHTYSAKRKLGIITPYLKKTQKIYESRDISPFSSEISKFCYTKRYRYRFHFGTKFLNFLTFFESLKSLFINMVKSLLMSAKLVTPDLVKIKVSSRNNVCDAIIVDYDVINKILSRDSSYNADLVM